MTDTVTTEAGKALLRHVEAWDLGERPDHEATAAKFIAAIEAEAVADYLASAEFVERLTEALSVTHWYDAEETHELIASGDEKHVAAAIARALTGDSNERT